MMMMVGDMWKPLSIKHCDSGLIVVLSLFFIVPSYCLIQQLC